MSYEDYVRENKIEDKSEEEKNLELIVSIIKTHKINSTIIQSFFNSRI